MDELPPDLDPQMQPDGSPDAMRCGVCRGARVYRSLVSLDGTSRSLIYCPTCDAIPRMSINRPPKETT